MQAIVPIQPCDANPGGASPIELPRLAPVVPLEPNPDLIDTAQMPRPVLTVHRTLTGISAALDEHSSAPAPLPFWQTKPCPPWCREKHHARDLDDDRIHTNSDVPTLYLSLYNGQSCGNDVFVPPHLLLSAAQNYRAAEPDVVMTFPIPRARPDEYDETDVHLTLAEARAVRDGLSELLSALEQPTR